ncbi:MAG: arsenite methyltransferase [Bacteroidetes bacterium]|jgi:SAM-dependent methyltransferase|nr:arsenite methyltransferase [Bacteroidota bacterium]
MKNENDLKKVVREKYGQLGEQEGAGAGHCCGPDPTQNKVYNIMMDDYTDEAGYVQEADLGLGCGLPTAFAQITAGDTVIDLGSGAGNDCFVARHETGAKGKVIGVDFTPSMIRKARSHAERLGYNNVEFRQGDIEDLPVNSGIADVVVSNCVLNLVPNKPQVVAEIYRVLKPGGHFSISDIVLRGALPAALKEDAEMYAGCVAGAIQQSEYLSLIEKQGFQNIRVQKEKPIQLPEDVLRAHLSPEAFTRYKSSGTGIYSITVYAEKSPKAEDLPTAPNPPAESSTCCG